MAEKTQNDFCLTLKDLSQFLKKESQFLKKDLKKKINYSVNSPIIPPQIVRKYLELKKYHYPHEVISFQMLKGGVAKTTTALNLGLRAAMFGARVLFIDLDQQANLTFALGVEDDHLPVWLDIVEKKKNIDETVQFIDENIDLIPSGLNNSVLDRVLVNSQRNWSLSVKQPLEKIKHRYDLIIIDTAPAISAVNTAVSIASDRIILPVNPDKFSYLGLEKNLHELRMIKEDFNLKTMKTQIVFTKFDAREKTSHEFLQKCIGEHPDEILQTYIRTSSEVKNAIRSEKHLFVNPSTVKEDYNQLTLEILKWNERS